MSYKRKIEDKLKLEKVFIKTSKKSGKRKHYGHGVYYDESKARYIRYSCQDSSRSRAFKRYSRRKTRRYINKKFSDATIVKKGNILKHYYDYWWLIT